MTELVTAATVVGKTLQIVEQVRPGTREQVQQQLMEWLGRSPDRSAYPQLRSALGEAFATATGNMGRSEDEGVLWAQVEETGSDLIRSQITTFADPILEALLFNGFDNGIWSVMIGRLDRYSLDVFSRHRLAFEKELESEFSRQLRKDRHRKALTEFQQVTLGEAVRLLKSRDPEEAKALQPMASDPNLVERLVTCVLDSLDAQRRNEQENFLALRDQFELTTKTLNGLSAMIQGGFVDSAGEPIQVVGLDQFDRVRTELTDERLPWVGRDNDLQDLTRKALAAPYLAVTSTDPGAGKSSLLAHWVDKMAAEYGPERVCRHFFRSRVTDRLGGGMASIARQLLRVHGIRGNVPEDQLDWLKATTNSLLALPHTNPLLIVLDGIDDIADPRGLGEFAFEPYWFPEQLGENVHVVFGFRFTSKLGNVNKLSDQLQIKEIIDYPLDNLGVATIASLLDAPRKQLAQAIFKRTGGLAIYVAAVAEAVNSASTDDEASEAVDHLPSSFADYVNESLDRATTVHRQWIDPLGFLAVASGPLTYEELTRLCKQSPERLTMADLRNSPTEIDRWLKRTEAGALTYSHVSIARARTDALGSDAGELRARLLDDCAAWAEHNGPYCLTSHPDDLIHAIRIANNSDKAWESLRALALNDEYRTAQRAIAPHDPELPIRTIQTAIRGAVIKNELTAAVELVFAHLFVVGTVVAESPLDESRRGSFERAVELTKLGERQEVNVLNLLLIGWHETSGGRTRHLDDIAKLLNALPKFEVVGWLKSAVVTIAVSADALMEHDGIRSWICTRTNHETRVEIVVALADRARFDLARATLETFPRVDDSKQIPALEKIARAEIVDGQIDAAQATANRISDKAVKVGLLVRIAKAYAENGNDTASRAILAAIQASLDETSGILVDRKIDLLIAKANAHVDLGDREAACATLGDAAIAANAESPASLKAHALIAIAEAYARLDFHESVRTHLEAAWKAAKTIANQNQRAWILVKLAEAQVSNGDFDRALQTVSAISQPESWERRIDRVLVSIALHQAEQVDVATALEVTSRASRRSEAIASVTKALAVRGHIDLARTIAAAVPSSYGAFVAVAEGAAARGDIETALTISSELGSEHFFDKLRLQVAIAGALAERGNVVEALAAANEAIRDDRKIEAFELVVTKLIDQRRFDLAGDVVGEISYAERRAGALARIANSLARLGDAEQAQAALEAIRSTFGPLSEDTFRKQALIGVAQALAMHNDVSTAVQAIDSIPDKLFRARGLSRLAQELAACDLVDNARDVASWIDTTDEDRLVAFSLESQRDEAVVAVIKALARTGQWGEAYDLAETEGDFSVRDRGLCEIAAALAQQNDVGGAQAIADRLPPGPYKDDALVAIVVALASDGKCDDASELVKGIVGPGADQPALAAIAGCLTRQGRLDGARKIISGSGPFSRSVVCKVAQELAAQDRLADAFALADESLLFGDHIRNVISGALARQERTWEAREVASTIGDETLRAEALVDLAMNLYQDYPEEAQELLSEAEHLADRQPDGSKVFNKIAVLQLMQDDIIEARAIARRIVDEQIRGFLQIEIARACLGRFPESAADALIDCAFGQRCAIEVPALLTEHDPARGTDIARVVMNESSGVTDQALTDSSGS